jgi:hypothetical protein
VLFGFSAVSSRGQRAVFQRLPIILLVGKSGVFVNYLRQQHWNIAELATFGSEL